MIPQYVRQHSWLGGCWVDMEVVEDVWRGGQQCGSHHHKEGGGNKEGSGNRCCGLSAANFPTIAFLLLLLLLIMLNILFPFENIKKTSPFTTMILKATFLQQREASALTIRTEKMPIKKVKMEDKRKHHHFLSLGIGDDGDDNEDPSVYILAVTNNSHFDERKMRNVLSALDASFLRNLLGDQ